jgi:diguanylate cyclase (GGDEF)-like protein/PAS domain S-box-containing protein
VSETHSLLKRQLKRWFGGDPALSPERQGFFDAVDRAYHQFDVDRAMLERSLELSSQELLQANSEMRAVFARLINSSVDGILAFDRECRYTVWNPGMERITGVSEVQALGKSAFEVFPMLEETGDGRFFSEALAGKTIVAKERSCLLPALGQGFFEGHYSPLFNESGQIIGGLAIIRDVTDRKQAEGLLRKRVEQQRIAKEIGEICLEASRLSEIMDQAARRIAAVLKADLSEVLTLDDQHEVLLLVAGVGWKQGVVGRVIVSKGPESQAGYTLLVNCPVMVDDLQTETRFTGSSMLDEHRAVSGLSVPMVSRSRTLGVLSVYSTTRRAFSPDEVEFLQSVSNLIAVAIERRKVEETLEQYAIHDALTGMYNRRYFHGRVNEEVARAARNQRPLAIMLCDLDRFKAINDTHGHERADEILKAVATSIQGSIRETDLVFRWGADEIVVLVPDATREAVVITADRMRRGIRKLGEAFGCEIDLSIGVGLYPQHGANPEELMRVTDRALYIAKKGGDKVHIGEEEYRLDDQSIKVVFQPIVDLRTGRVVGFEALSRDPQNKSNIIEMFRRYQAIGHLRELKRICFELQLKVAQELGLTRMFINVDFQVLNELDPVLKPDGMEVILEISEVEALHDLANHLSIARKWRSRGFRFAMDDFGAGFISLPFIGQLIPDYIKLDRSTILQAVSSENFRVFSTDLVRAMQNYATAGIIAEGIETEKELEVVKDMGISLGQGYLLGMPQALTRADVIRLQP